jgi:GMP synthase-like glutamine amidotransferase
VEVLSLIHQDDAGAGVFGDAAAEAGHDLEEASLALGRAPSRPVHEYGAVMVFGGDMNVDEEDGNPWMREEKALIRDLLARERPVLGVCLGSQLIAEAAGARVGRLPGGPEVGWYDVELAPAAQDDPVFGDLPRRFLAFQWHSYGFDRPPGGVELARGDAGLQAYRVGDAPAWGIQFHAEVSGAILASWLESYSGDDDARAAGVEPERLAEQNEREIARWNELGRRLCNAFIQTAASR